LSGNISTEDIIVALHEIDYVISVKQTTDKRLTPEGGATHTSVHLFLAKVARSQ
jgi:hypothetical protein